MEVTKIGSEILHARTGHVGHDEWSVSTDAGLQRGDNQWETWGLKKTESSMLSSLPFRLRLGCTSCRFSIIIPLWSELLSSLKPHYFCPGQWSTVSSVSYEEPLSKFQQPKQWWWQGGQGCTWIICFKIFLLRYCCAHWILYYCPILWPKQGTHSKLLVCLFLDKR